MNYLLNRIEDRKKYIEGLDRISENKDKMTLAEYNQTYQEISDNQELSNISKKFYLSLLKAELCYRSLIFPYSKLIAYINYSRGSELLVNIFKTDYRIIPISYTQLYRLFTQLTRKEVDEIILKMDLSLNTINGVLKALDDKSEPLFVSTLESEPKNLTVICKQLHVYSIIHALGMSFLEADFSDESFDLLSSLLNTFVDLKIFKNEEYNKEIEFLVDFCNTPNEEYTELLELIEDYPNEYSNEVESILYEKKYRPDCILKQSKALFCWIYILIDMISEDLRLSKDELNYLNKILYGNKECYDIVELAERLVKYGNRINEENKSETDESQDFQIPDDFFYNKMYTTESEEDEWIFSIDLDETDNKKVQALQKFINKLAEHGYIEDSFHAKSTFLYRITGRKLPNTKPGRITWKDEMKNYNCFCYLVKKFEQDFLNRSMRNKQSRLYEKAQRLFGIDGKIDNPSGKANDIKKTRFIIYYEQFKNDMK